MSIILVTASKGGVGKSTTTINLASELVSRGYSVAIIDADGQGSVFEWSQTRNDDESLRYIQVIQLAGKINKPALEFARGFDFTLVDTAGRLSTESVTAMFIADILVSPCACSQLDLDELHTLAEAAENAPMLEKKLIVHNLATTHPRAKISERAEFLEYVRGIQGFKAAESFLSYRKPYREMFSAGVGAIEQSNKDCRAEVAALTDEILGELNNGY